MADVKGIREQQMKAQSQRQTTAQTTQPIQPPVQHTEDYKRLLKDPSSASTLIRSNTISATLSTKNTPQTSAGGMSMIGMLTEDSTASEVDGVEEVEEQQEEEEQMEEETEEQQQQEEEQQQEGQQEEQQEEEQMEEVVEESSIPVSSPVKRQADTKPTKSEPVKLVSITKGTFYTVIIHFINMSKENKPVKAPVAEQKHSQERRTVTTIVVKDDEGEQQEEEQMEEEENQVAEEEEEVQEVQEVQEEEGNSTGEQQQGEEEQAEQDVEPDPVKTKPSTSSKTGKDPQNKSIDDIWEKATKDNEEIYQEFIEKTGLSDEKDDAKIFSKMFEVSLIPEMYDDLVRVQNAVTKKPHSGYVFKDHQLTPTIAYHIMSAKWIWVFVACTLNKTLLHVANIVPEDKLQSYYGLIKEKITSIGSYFQTQSIDEVMTKYMNCFQIFSALSVARNARSMSYKTIEPEEGTTSVITGLPIKNSAIELQINHEAKHNQIESTKLFVEPTKYRGSDKAGCQYHFERLRCLVLLYSLRQVIIAESIKRYKEIISTDKGLCTRHHDFVKLVCADKHVVDFFAEKAIPAFVIGKQSICTLSGKIDQSKVEKCEALLLSLAGGNAGVPEGGEDQEMEQQQQEEEAEEVQQQQQAQETEEEGNYYEEGQMDQEKGSEGVENLSKQMSIVNFTQKVNPDEFIETEAKKDLERQQAIEQADQYYEPSQPEEVAQPKKSTKKKKKPVFVQSTREPLSRSIKSDTREFNQVSKALGYADTDLDEYEKDGWIEIDHVEDSQYVEGEDDEDEDEDEYGEEAEEIDEEGEVEEVTTIPEEIETIQPHNLRTAPQRQTATSHGGTKKRNAEELLADLKKQQTYLEEFIGHIVKRSKKMSLTINMIENMLSD